MKGLIEGGHFLSWVLSSLIVIQVPWMVLVFFLPDVGNVIRGDIPFTTPSVGIGLLALSVIALSNIQFYELRQHKKEDHQ